MHSLDQPLLEHALEVAQQPEVPGEFAGVRLFQQEGFEAHTLFQKIEDVLPGRGGKVGVSGHELLARIVGVAAHGPTQPLAPLLHGEVEGHVQLGLGLGEAVARPAGGEAVVHLHGRAVVDLHVIAHGQQPVVGAAAQDVPGRAASHVEGMGHDGDGPGVAADGPHVPDGPAEGLVLVQRPGQLFARGVQKDDVDPLAGDALHAGDDLDVEVGRGLGQPLVGLQGLLVRVFGGRKVVQPQVFEIPGDLLQAQALVALGHAVDVGMEMQVEYCHNVRRERGMLPMWFPENPSGTRPPLSSNGTHEIVTSLPVVQRGAISRTKV